MSVCSVSRGISFASRNRQIPRRPVAPHWMWVEVLGCVGSDLPSIHQIYRSLRCRGSSLGGGVTERIQSTVGVGLSCSEARVIVGLPYGMVVPPTEADPKSSGFFL